MELPAPEPGRVTQRWLLLGLRLGVCGALLAAAPLSGQTLLEGATSIQFDAAILADLGIAVEGSGTASPTRPGGWGFAVSAGDSSVELHAPGGDFEGFAEAHLVHAGGLTFQAGGQTIPLDGVELSLASPPHLLEVRGAGGETWLHVSRPHALLSADAVLTIANADLLVAPALAAALGRPELAGSYVGVLDATLRLERAAPGPVLQGAGDCVPDLEDPVDVELIVLTSTTQAAREPGGRVSLAASAELVNHGPGDVAWYRGIAPDSPLGPHPYLVLHFYRLSNGVLEQIGRSDLKHAFFATNTGCPCAGGHVLYAGCEDQYGVNTNLNQIHLAPRDEIDAALRSWTSLGSHFDALPVDDVRDHFGTGDHDAFEHRLVVQEPDLQTPGASYFIEGWYLAPNDTDLLNSLGHRRVTPSFSSSTWAFPNATVLEKGSILDVFVDPDAPGPGELSSLVDTGKGRVQLAVAATAAGGGVYHYEWALLNFDYEPRLRSFSVPLLPGLVVTNPGFGDADGDPGNDWTASVDGDRIVWTAPAGNALDWGRLYNFRMDVDAAPVASVARMQSLDAAELVTAASLAPAPASAVPALPWPFLAPLLAGFALVVLRRVGSGARSGSSR